MYKLIFIIPYFGKLPIFFSEWAYSVSYLEEQEIDFVIITDDTSSHEIPNNIKIINMTFDDFVNKIQDKFDFKISLNDPYKICDYRPAFGYIFNDLIEGYDFWGNCDLDQVWGDVRNFFTQDILLSYEKILYLGHCSLYKNNSKINKMFMLEGGMANYKEVFSSDYFYAFDEFSGMVAISKYNNLKTYYEPIYADISVRNKRIMVRGQINYKYQIVYWTQGKVYRSYIDEYNKVQNEEFLYFHFQKKKPRSINSLYSKPNAFLVRANEFIEFDVSELSYDFIIKNSDFTNEQCDKNDEREYLLTKIRSFLKSSKKDKVIWIRRKFYAKKL